MRGKKNSGGKKKFAGEKKRKKWRKSASIRVIAVSVTHQQAFNHTLLPIWCGMLADVWLRIG
jgi:hypothetical protein